MGQSIETKTARARLEVRREPHWSRVREGAYVGYRRMAEGEGTWLARWRDRAGAQHYRALGTILEAPRVRAYDAAVKAATEWFDACEADVAPKTATVADACDAYVKQIRKTDTRKADRTAVDIKRLIEGDPIAKIELGALREEDVDAWRERIATRPVRVGRGKKTRDRKRAPATVNRDCVPVRAALNLALDRKRVASDLAWRVALRPLKNADRRRELYLSKAERKRLIDAADAEVQPFVKALCMLPLRVGALAALTVGDFNPRTASLRVGQDKTNGDRRVGLPPPIVAFLREQAKGKLPGAPLLATATGAPWRKDTWKKAIAKAVKGANLPPGTTAYTLRHSTVTDLVAGGTPIYTVATLAGTSVAMIERFYGHLQQREAAAALATLVVA